MNKKILALVLGAAVAAAAAVPAFADAWREDGRGWWYQYSNGSWAAGGWEWIDGNNDGIAECYCFDNDGYLYVNTITPDGFRVNLSGQWVKDGKVMTQQAGADAGYQYDASSRVYSWMNGIYKADDGRTITLDAAGGDQMCAALYCYSEDGWNTSYVSGKVDENTRSIIIYYTDGNGAVRGYYQLYMDVEAKDIWFQTYDLGGNYVGSWYDGTYSR